MSSITTPATADAQCIEQGGYRWHVERVGSGPLALLLHGTGASTHSWAPLIPLLSEHYAVLAIDLPGHGRTGTPARADLSLNGMADAIADLLHRLDCQPEIGIGHSAGAAILAELHLQQQLTLTRLISINGALLPLAGLAGWFFSPMARIGANTPGLARVFARRARDSRQVKRLLDSTGSTVDATRLAAYQALFSNPDHVSGVLRMMANWRLESLMARLPELQVPTCLIAASKDGTIPLRDAYRLKALIPDSRLTVIENAGHLVHEEVPETVAHHILATPER